MITSKVDVRVADCIAVLTLNEPPANTYSYEMMRELDAAILDARMNTDVHVIVLTGAGEKFFCAGATIGMLKDADPDYKYYFCLHANEPQNRHEQTPKLVMWRWPRTFESLAKTAERSGCPKWPSASCRAPAVRSASAASSAKRARWSS